MDRRRLIGGMAGGAIALGGGLSFAGAGSAGERIYRVGMLSYNASLMPDSGTSKLLFTALEPMGFVEGKNVVTLRRHAARDRALLDRLAAELVAWKPDIIIAGDTTATIALKPATAQSKTPVVFWSLDPMEAGVVNDYNRPGTNFTGSADAPDTQVLEMRFLKEVVPNLTKVAMLYNPTYAPAPAALRGFQAAGKDIGVTVTPFDTRTTEAFDPTIAAMKAAGMQAMVVGPHALFSQNGKLIGEAAQKHKMPTVSVVGSVMQAGGIAVFGPDFRRIWTGQADHVAKILRGADPATLPVKRPPAAFSVNVAAAQKLGLSIPAPVLARASQVVR